MDAIQVIWLKKWLSPEKNRPVWAYLTDEIIHRNIAKNPMVEPRSRQSWILQSWHESMAKQAKISPMIREMLRVARKYNIGIDARKISKRTKGEMPIWHHSEAVEANYHWNKKAARCLRNNHQIRKVKDLEENINGSYHINCNGQEQCQKIGETIMWKLPDKYNPLLQTPKKIKERNLDHTPRRIEKNENIDITKEMRTFNPNITEQGNPLYSVRIFGKREGQKTRKRKDQKTYKPAYRKTINGTKEQRIIYTDGSSLQNGTENGASGAGVWEKEGSEMNLAIRLPKGPQTNQRAELAAILITLEKNQKDNLEIRSDSRTSIEGITKHLETWEDKDWLGVKNQH
ncbi:hypothetical protein BDZ94DRAFT_1179178 [Collybia nuda]|uniref:ribonuclease H n=1 Tax=Collybia nuda TaxID=64659 RepID=A0A9P5XU74_9AGAR|nr:hypothetical protein BDZ94DRAFT_1179178 [Collybia nuda]